MKYLTSIFAIALTCTLIIWVFFYPNALPDSANDKMACTFSYITALFLGVLVGREL